MPWQVSILLSILGLFLSLPKLILKHTVHPLPQTETEVREVEDEISCLEKSLALKIPPMMVTQTRLENRIQRPNVELCRDQTQYQMVEEIAKIGDSQQALKEKLAVTQ